jgi:hypothetical protein
MEDRLGWADSDPTGPNRRGQGLQGSAWAWPQGTWSRSGELRHIRQLAYRGWLYVLSTYWYVILFASQRQRFQRLHTFCLKKVPRTYFCLKDIPVCTLYILKAKSTYFRVMYHSLNFVLD